MESASSSSSGSEETTYTPEPSSLGENLSDWLMVNSPRIEFAAGLAVLALALGVLLRLIWKCDANKCCRCGLPRTILFYTGQQLVDYASTRGVSWIEAALLALCVGEFFDDFSRAHPQKEKRRFKIFLLPIAFALHVFNHEHKIYDAIWSYGSYLELMIAFQLIVIDRKRNFDQSIYYHCIASAAIKLFALSPQICQFYDICLKTNYFSRKKFCGNMTAQFVNFIIIVFIHMWKRGKRAWHNTKEEDDAEDSKTNVTTQQKNLESELDDEKGSINGSDWEIVDEDNDKDMDEVTEKNKTS